MGIAGGGSGPINLRQVRAKHLRFQAAFSSLVDATCEKASYIAVKHVLQTPHFNPKTGALQRATKAKTVRLRSGRIVTVSNDLPYAAPIDLGARPHVIKAVRAPFLSFVWNGRGAPAQFRGKRVNFRSVHHPGNKPYRFLWHATFGAYRFAGHSFKAGMHQVAKRF